MKVKFESSFQRDLKKIKDQQLLATIKTVIIDCQNAKSLAEIQKIKKLKGFLLKFKNYKNLIIYK